MKHLSPTCRVDAGQKAYRHLSRPMSARLACALLLPALLGGCDDRAMSSPNRAPLVRTDVVQPQEREAVATLTGEVQARFRADLSFRLSGRVIARLVDVGAHVDAGEVLARIDPTEQQADLDAASAAVAAAESQLRVATATFERQKTLISNGFTTRAAFDQAQERLRSAEGSLEAAKAQLGTATDALGYTELRASAAGVITARNLEVGQVVEAAQPIFSLAQDGDRDAVFDVYESMFFRDSEDDQVSLTLVSDRHVTASGNVREVSPAVDPKSATIRVKVKIENPPAEMMLGSVVTGTVRWKPAYQITLPWTALMASGSTPAVWIVDPTAKTVSLKPVAIETYETGGVVIKSGLEPGERVVVDCGKLLSSGESVTYDGDAS